MSLDITLEYAGNDVKPLIVIHKKDGEKIIAKSSYLYPEPKEDFIMELKEKGFEDWEIEKIVEVIEQFSCFNDDLLDDTLICDSCGHELEWDYEEERLICPHCGLKYLSPKFPNLNEDQN